MEEKREKRTGKFGRFAGWTVSLLLIAALAWGFVGMYPRMIQEARQVYSSHVEQQIQDTVERYLEKTYSLIDGMYADWYIHTEGKGNKTAGEIILGPLQEKYAVETSYGVWYEGRSETLTRWYLESYPKELEDSGIEYFLYTDSMEKGYGTLKPEEVSTDAANYPLYIEVQFDEQGLPVVKQQRGVEDIQNNFTARHEIRLIKNELLVEYETGETVTHGILENVTVLLACDLETYNSLTGKIIYHSWMMWELISAIEVDYTIFVLAAFGIAILLGLLLPTIRPLGLKEGWKAHIPVEVLAVAGACVVYGTWEYLPEIIVKCQLELEHPGTFFSWYGVMKDIAADGREAFLILAGNVALWFVILFAVYLCAVNVRQLFAKGIVRFFKENTLTGKIICLLFSLVKKAVQFCGIIDFSNKGNRNFFLAVVLNFMVIALLCCTWFFGILLAIPYSLFVFWLLQKWWNKIRTDYVVLLSTTEEMAGGVTDVEYIGNAGVFHELQTALSGVQEGFHTAVQEEVKSQKMKTELITNVSHDLKTPLTAIITYVDLLKNETLTAEERQEYVEVLDRKSLRLKSLIEDLFEISKATSGNIQLDKVNLDLGQLIEEVQLELEEEIMNSGIAFKVNLPEEKVLVHLDAQKTCRIFENLTMNVLRHGLTGSRAYISMEQTEKNVSVIYKNVSAAEINYSAEEIMERFTRGDASRNTEGSGLGLAIVKSFAEAQGGKVKVELEDDLFKVIVTFPKV